MSDKFKWAVTLKPYEIEQNRRVFRKGSSKGLLLDYKSNEPKTDKYYPSVFLDWANFNLAQVCNLLNNRARKVNEDALKSLVH